MEDGVQEGQAQRAELHGVLQVLGECSSKNHGAGWGRDEGRYLSLSPKHYYGFHFYSMSQAPTEALETLVSTSVCAERVPVQKVMGTKLVL